MPHVPLLSRPVYSFQGNPGAACSAGNLIGTCWRIEAGRSLLQIALGHRGALRALQQLVHFVGGDHVKWRPLQQRMAHQCRGLCCLREYLNVPEVAKSAHCSSAVGLQRYSYQRGQADPSNNALRHEMQPVSNMQNTLPSGI